MHCYHDLAFATCPIAALSALSVSWLNIVRDFFYVYKMSVDGSKRRIND